MQVINENFFDRHTKYYYLFLVHLATLSSVTRCAQHAAGIKGEMHMHF
jgi:hypothetical protein